jgi:hypothetical protein
MNQGASCIAEVELSEREHILQARHALAGGRIGIARKVESCGIHDRLTVASDEVRQREVVQTVRGRCIPGARHVEGPRDELLDGRLIGQSGYGLDDPPGAVESRVVVKKTFPSGVSCGKFWMSWT